jgi:hypothetical protein
VLVVSLCILKIGWRQKFTANINKWFTIQDQPILLCQFIIFTRGFSELLIRLCRIDPLLGNDSVYTSQQTHNMSCVLCGQCNNSLQGNIAILDDRRGVFCVVRTIPSAGQRANRRILTTEEVFLWGPCQGIIRESNSEARAAGVQKSTRSQS